MPKQNVVGTTIVDLDDVQHTGTHRFTASLTTFVDATDATKAATLDLSGIATGTTASIVVGTTSQTFITHAAGVAKAGTSAGWVVNAGDNVALTTLPQSQTGSTLVVPIFGLKVGWTITGFHLIGQIESAGGTVTVDAVLHKQTAAAADITDANIGAITQISVTADTAITATNSTKTLAVPEVIAATETFYVLLTATTGASCDIAMTGIGVICSLT